MSSDRALVECFSQDLGRMSEEEISDFAVKLERVHQLYRAKCKEFIDEIDKRVSHAEGLKSEKPTTINR